MPKTKPKKRPVGRPRKPAGEAIVFHLDQRAEALQDVNTGPPDDLLLPVETARWLGVTTGWLHGARRRGDGPPFVQLTERQFRYRRDAVKEWLAARTKLRAGNYMQSEIRA